MEHLRTARAQALLKAMLEARELLDKEHERYQQTLAAAMNADARAGDLQAARHAGRAYAQALTAYSNAAMTWLTYVDTGLQSVQANHAK
ncbi:MAG TPA: hypothetical protein VH640_11835 [Bryobacteraceae bacterium]